MRVSVQRLENVSDYGPAYLRPHKDGGLVRYADHLVAVEVAHSAGMREALADFLTSIDEDDPVYMRGHSVGIHDGIEAGRTEALREARNQFDYGLAYPLSRQGAIAAIDSLNTSLPTSDDSTAPVLPTSVAPAGEDYGAPVAALTPWDMRVLVELLQSARALVESEDFDGFALGRATGWAEARDAVAAAMLHHHECDVFYSSNPTCDCVHGEVLAAIDALRGEP